MQISLVPPNRVDEVWPLVEKYLDGAADYTYGRYKVDDIHVAITDYGFNLWIAYDEEEIKGAVVTNMVIYPRKKFLSMVFCGGIYLMEWKDLMLKTLQKYARDAQCDGLEATARLGWTKVFKADGHKSLWQTFELPAAELGESHG